MKELSSWYLLIIGFILTLSGCATPREVITKENLQELRLLRTRNEVDYVGIWFLKFTGIYGTTFSPDSRLIAFGFGYGSGEIEAVKVVDADTLALIEVIKTPNNLEIVFSGDGTVLASAHKSVELWNVDKVKRISVIDYPSLAEGFQSWDYIMGIAFNPTKPILAVGDTRKGSVLTLWDTDANQKIKELRNCVGRPPVFTRDGAILAAGISGAKEILLSNGDNGAALRILKGHAKPVCSRAFSLDGKMLASSEFNRWRDQKSGTTELTIKLWDVERGQLIGEIKGHDRAIRDLHFSAKGDLLVGYQKHQRGSDEGDSIVFFDVAERKEILRITTKKRIYGLVFRPDGKAIVVEGGGELFLYGVP